MGRDKGARHASIVTIFIFTLVPLFFVDAELKDVFTLNKTPVSAEHTWCTWKLCTQDAILNEIAEQKKTKQEFQNVTVFFSNKELLEKAFMNIFYSSPIVLRDHPLIVVTTSYGHPPHYRLDWINSQPWPVFVSTKEANFGISSEPWGNLGQEIASYMRFILMFWEYLPEHIAFVHGHEKTWHQEGYAMSYMLRNVCYHDHEYISLSAYESGNAWRPMKGSLQYFKIMKKYWKLVRPFLGELPKQGFREKCCAQFIVSRGRIKARPKALYQLILTEMTDPKKNYKRAPHGKNSGWDLIHFWEAIWHYIMGEAAIVNTRRKYGRGIDMNRETGKPLSKNPERTLKNVIACSHQLLHG
ncbi:unnamed protein product [Bathycoccus prasinos]